MGEGVSKKGELGGRCKSGAGTQYQEVGTEYPEGSEQGRRIV
jgi:hypothetical protein